MNEYFDLLRKIGLFKNIADTELASMLQCLHAEVRHIDRDEIILLAGDKPEHIGVVLSGQLLVLREDCDGYRSIIAAVTPGELFAEALCCAGVTESPVTVTAAADSTVMLLTFSRILRNCPQSCDFHTRLIENMLGLIANKNLLLQSRMEVISQKSIRAKVTRCLEGFAPTQGRNITLPFNRAELAEYLCVERSALSHELARMKQDGLIDYWKNCFILNE